MNRVVSFLKTTAVGGLLILLPLLLLQMMVVEAFGLLVALAKPIANLLPSRWVEWMSAPALLALVLLFVASFVLGLAAKSTMGRAVGKWLERNTIGRLPLYGVLTGLAARLVEIGEGSAFKPALRVSGDGQREFAYLIEDHGDGNATIMLPWAPTPLSGSVMIVPMSQLTMLDASLGEVTRVMGQWGAGAHKLMSRPAKTALQ